MLSWRALRRGLVAGLWFWLSGASVGLALPGGEPIAGPQAESSARAQEEAGAPPNQTPASAPDEQEQAGEPGAEPPQPSPAPCDAEPYIVLTFAPGLPEELAREIFTDLEAELAPRGITLCAEAQPASAPIALITASLTRDTLAIALDDRTKQKQVSRDFKFQGVPENGRALAAAIAIDELLRAAWAEVPAAAAPAGAEPAAEQDTAPHEDHPPATPAVPRTYGLALATGFLQAARSWNMFSLGLRASLWPLRWAWIETGASLLRALRVEVPLGEITAQGASVDLTLGGCPLHTERAVACLGVRGALDRVHFRGHAAPDTALARRAAATALRVEGVGSLGLSLPRGLFAFAQLSLGAPVQRVLATDGSETLMGLQGIFWSGALGLGVER